MVTLRDLLEVAGFETFKIYVDKTIHGIIALELDSRDEKTGLSWLQHLSDSTLGLQVKSLTITKKNVILLYLEEAKGG